MDEKSNIRGATNVYILGSYGTNREWEKNYPQNGNMGESNGGGNG